jgi:hypothetical protein
MSVLILSVMGGEKDDFEPVRISRDQAVCVCDIRAFSCELASTRFKVLRFIDNQLKSSLSLKVLQRKRPI